MKKQKKIEVPTEPKAPKRSFFGFIGKLLIATFLVLVLVSTGYCVFITVVGVGGKTNAIIALPATLAVACSVTYGIYSSVNQYFKVK